MKKIKIIAGQCAVDEYYLETAKELKELGIEYLRSCIYKPRSKPDRWDGIKEYGLPMLKEAKHMGFKIVSEAMSIRQMLDLYNYIDIFQVGTRNMQSSELLKEFGEQSKPVMLKRAMCATIEEFVWASEFITSQGNKNVMLCERGIRTFETYTRNTFDINAIPAIKNLCDLEVIADPSHGTGRKELVSPVTLGAIAAGADGILIEVHKYPEKSQTDAGQTLSIDEFKELLEKIKELEKIL